MTSLVTVKDKGQVTLPAKLRTAAGIETGDLLSAKLEKGKIILEIQVAFPKGVLEGLAELKAGKKGVGPFDQAELKAWFIQQEKEGLRSKKRSR